MPDLMMEMHAVRVIASLTGWNISNIRPGLDAQGIDVLFDLDGRCVGVQHTVLHPDEGHTPGVRGSPIRAKEEAIARATQRPFGIWGKFDYRPALLLRIDEKIAKATEHNKEATERNNGDLIAETWLVISANIGKWGAAASTTIVADALRAEDLNALCHAQLAASEFECVCLVLHMGNILWGWDRPGGWRVLADPDAEERERHRKTMADLIFNRRR